MTDPAKVRQLMLNAEKLTVLAAACRRRLFERPTLLKAVRHPTYRSWPNPHVTDGQLGAGHRYALT